MSWYDNGSWHENLRNSDGLKPQPRQYATIENASERAQAIYRTVLPHYQHLHAHRLRPMHAEA